jgi:hypothetical protein
MRLTANLRTPFILFFFRSLLLSPFLVVAFTSTPTAAAATTTGTPSLTAKNGEPTVFNIPFTNEGEERIQLIAPKSLHPECRWITPLPRLNPGEKTRLTAVCRFSGGRLEETQQRRVDLPLFIATPGKPPSSIPFPLIARVSSSGAKPVIQIQTSATPPRLTIEATSCPPLQDQLQALNTLSRSDASPECLCSSGTCRLTLDEALPPGIRALTGMRANCDGPNCFNAAFVTSGVLDRIRHVGSDETSALLESSRCSEVPIGDTPAPGDLIVIREGKQLIHGFTFISPELVFSKANLSAKSAYEFASLDSVLADFNVPARCRGIPAHAAEQLDCARTKRSSFFRCREDSRPRDSASFSAWRKSINSMECAVAGAISVGSPSSPLEFSQLRTLLESNQALYESVRKTSPENEAERSELTLMRGELESLYFQLKYMDPLGKTSRITH